MTPKRNTRTDEYKSVFGNRKKGSGGTGGTADWATAACDSIQRLVTTVTSRGGAVRLGYTRDGGAYAVGFYYGSEATTEYCRPSEDLEAFLQEWIDFYEDLPYSGGKSPAQ